ncbi:tigger transposable element-derived protein 4-like [Gigantopelta aegis]|uniref:tigger transposable element-derived protein 4-like n=1 Tax=Gigantopelta aegis TaxID=1735272 RepID=UPI001B88B0BB|nr:tigger transposable element-derived protein 4-like [Gigantopelta aegis]XP_041377826.1 tigger transposable element-derived protein 4-like [Gigantopelta aegis]
MASPVRENPKTSFTKVSKKRKRVELSLSEKVNVIDQLNKKVPQTKVAQQFGVSQAQISRVATNKSKILSLWERSENPNRKRQRFGKNTDVESAMKSWLVEARNNNIPLTGIVLKEKAKTLAQTLNKPDFIPTSGWISRWKEKCSLSTKKPKKVEDLHAAEKWVNEDIPKLLKQYSPNDVYTAKETGLYFRATPEGIYVIKSEQKNDKSTEEDKMTALVACNMSGTDKRRLLLIGENKIPSCVTGIPVDYMLSKRAWITSDIFRQWCFNLDRDMKSQKRKIVLIVNHCSEHPVDLVSKLDHVKLLFFPLNTKQPCEQGILTSLKYLYKKQIVHRIVAELNIGNNIETNSCVREISLLDAIHMLQKSWIEVTKETVISCFRKAGFQLGSADEDVPETDEHYTAPDGISQLEFDKFVKVDENIPCFGIRPDDEICASILNAETLGQSDENNDKETNELTRTTGSDALKSLVTVRRYLECRGVVNFEAFYSLETTVQSVIRGAAKKRTKE